MAAPSVFAKQLVHFHSKATRFAKAALLLGWAVLVSAKLPWKRVARAGEQAANTMSVNDVTNAEQAARHEIEEAAKEADHSSETKDALDHAFGDKNGMSFIRRCFKAGSASEFPTGKRPDSAAFRDIVQRVQKGEAFPTKKFTELAKATMNSDEYKKVVVSTRRREALP